MFPQFPHYPRRLFSRPDPLRDTPLSPQPDQQLQAELEQAAEVGMVATRSQDHTLDGIEVQDIIENGPPSIGTVTKRKNGYGEDSTPTKSADNKRRRISKSKVNEASKPIAAEPSEMNSKKQNREASKRRTRESTPGEGTTLRDLTTASIPPPTASLAPKKRRSEILAGQEVMTSVVIKLKESTTSENPAHEGSEKVARNPMASQTTKRRKKPREDGEAKNRLPKKTMEVNKIRKAAVPDPTKTKSPAAKATKATHKRFGSEEIKVPEPQPQVKEGNGKEDRSLEESEDEAPETTTVSAEKEKARMAAVETENAAARQEAAEKVKRRERDLRLKLQAKSYKKHSWLGEQLSVKLPKPEAIKPTVPQATSIDEAAPESAAIIDEKQISPVKSKSSSKTPLPALLPDEVLAVELVTRLLTPPLSVDKVFTNKKRRFLDTDSKPPKDIKYGRTKVRVLQANRTTLPPKASTIGKALRESWLLGRRGLKGGLAVPRRKPCGGFVRK